MALGFCRKGKFKGYATSPLHFFQDISLLGWNGRNRFGGTMQSDLALVALHTFISADLQKEGTVAECKAAVHTFSATDANIVIDDVLKIGGFDFSAGKGIDRTELIFCSGVPCKGLWIEKAGAEIAVTAHGGIVETLDRRNRFVASVRTDSATDALSGIDLPDERIAGDFLFCGERTYEAG